jgi:hypothetical protein
VKLQSENAGNENKNQKKEEKKLEDRVNSLLEQEKELQKVFPLFHTALIHITSPRLLFF